MKVIKVDEVAKETTPRPIIMGETSVQPLVTRDLSENLVMIVRVSPGERHRHRAAGDSLFSHISITPPSTTTILG